MDELLADFLPDELTIIRADLLCLHPIHARALFLAAFLQANDFTILPHLGLTSWFAIPSLLIFELVKIRAPSSIFTAGFS
ncbi:MAG: hypothetical protein WC120_03540 [Parcubacteria group bacterium]